MRSFNKQLLAGLWVALITGCAAGESVDTGFGGSFNPGGDVPMASDSSDGTGGTGGSAGEGGSGGATGGAASTGMGANDGSDTGMTSAGMDAFPPMESSGDTDPTAAGSSSDGGMMDGGIPGAQPAAGMWAHCTKLNNDACGAGAPTCIYLDDDGFCSAQDCLNAAADCAPAPAGTSVVPICASAVVTAVCALDCTAAACPAGMVCSAVSINMGPDYMLCI